MSAPSEAEYGHLLSLLQIPGRADRFASNRTTPIDWEKISSLASVHGLTPLLFYHLQGDPAPVPPAVLATLRSDYLKNAAWTFHGLQELSSVLSAIQNTGAQVIALKGAHLAAAVYAEPGLRTMHDFDLLVKKGDLARAAKVMSQLGYTQSVSYDREIHHLPPFEKAGVPTIELHWTVRPPELPQIPLAEIWLRAQPATIAGVDTLTLCPEDLLSHVCLHTCGNPDYPVYIGLRPIYDLTAIIQKFENLDWGAVVSRAERWKITKHLLIGLMLAGDLFGARVPNAVIADLKNADFSPKLLDFAVQQIYARGDLAPDDEEQSIPMKLSTFNEERSVRARLSTLRHALFPPSGLMCQRYGVRPNSFGLFCWYVARPFQLLFRYGGVQSRLMAGDPKSRHKSRALHGRAVLQEWFRS